MEIYIIRHAESANNASPLESRVEDPTLSPVGYDQADFLAGRLRHIKPERILVSPFRRTLETLAPYLNSTEVVPEAWIDIHEQGGVVRGHEDGRYLGCPGMRRSEILQEYPDMVLPEEIDENGWWKSKPFETVAEAAERANRVAAHIRGPLAETNLKTVLISHGMFMRLLVSAIMGFSYEGYERLEEIANTGVTRFTIDGSVVRLGVHNCVRHIPDDQITGMDATHLRSDIPIPGKE